MMDPQILRILDVNANRAREAMRVLEEAARFILDDAELSLKLKTLRHDFSDAMQHVPTDPEALFYARDTAGDVGTQLSTQREYARESLQSVLIAAGKRLGEALRALEEYGKVISADYAQRIEQCRYRVYQLEKEVMLAIALPGLRQWKLCVLITESLCEHHDWQTVSREAMQAGADCIQLREKDLEGGALIKRAAWLREESEKISTDDLVRPTIIVNDRVDVALLSGADGVHLGQGDLPVPEAMKLINRPMIIGVSTGDTSEAFQALEQGAHYCGVGPMFPTTTKKKDHLAGPAYLRAYLKMCGDLPHLAIGGITPENIPQLREAGCQGVAVSSTVCGAKDVGKMLQELRAGLS